MKINKTNSIRPEITLLHLFLTFIKIGATSFGGFMALVSVVQKELVKKQDILKDYILLDAISTASVLPGPMAFNVVAYVGFKLNGIKGALVSMLGILLPSFVFMVILSYLYFKFGEVPVFDNFFKGVLPAVSAIVVTVAINMFKKHIKDYKQYIIAFAAVVVILWIKSIFITSIIIISGGLLGVILYGNKENKTDNGNKNIARGFKLGKPLILFGFTLTLFAIIIYVLPYITTGEFYTSAKINRDLMLTFSSISLTLFGGGYVIIPAMQEIIVNALGWLTTKEFVDAIALGQITPGPIFISATFIGYKIGGFLGALTATLAIFIPPAVLMIVFSEFIAKIKNSNLVKAAFKGLRPAVIGMIFAAAYTISSSYAINGFSIIIFLLVLLLCFKYRLDVIYIIPLSGILGVLFFNFL